MRCFHFTYIALATCCVFNVTRVFSAEPAATSTAQPAAATTAQPAAIDPHAIRIHLMDGSVVSGKLPLEQIEVETRFGKLQVPIKDLQGFTPGLESHPELAAKIDRWIEQLGSVDFDERESAQRELERLGGQVRALLEKFENDADNERKTRVLALMADIDADSEAAEGEAEAFTVRDKVETVEFSIVGSIATKSFTLDSLYGPLTVKLSDIRRAQRDFGGRPDERKSVDVSGDNLVQKPHKSSGLRVERGDRVHITAEGQLTMTPWGAGAVSTPDGGANYGWYVANSIPGGALVAAIGDDGEVFRVGSKSTFIAQRSGDLRFAIGMQADYANQVFPGEYKVKIRVQRKRP